MKIAILPSTQWDSVGNGIGRHSEAELCQDVAKRLKPKLQAAGHTIEIFAAHDNANSEGARNAVRWKAGCCISLHLDAANGKPAAMLCYQSYLTFGEAVTKAYAAGMGIKHKSPDYRQPGTKKGVAVLRIPTEARIPNCLIEMGDMNNPDGVNWLSADHREKAAVALTAAILLTVGGRITQEEEDMAVVGPGIETTKVGYEFYVGTPPGKTKAENVYVKVRNMKPESAHVTVKAISNDAIKDKSFDLKQNKGAEVDVAALGVTGSTLVEVVSNAPVYISFDQR